MSVNDHELEPFIMRWSKKVEFLAIQQDGIPFLGNERHELS